MYETAQSISVQEQALTLTSRFQNGMAIRPSSSTDAGSSINTMAHVGIGILYGL